MRELRLWTIVALASLLAACAALGTVSSAPAPVTPTPDMWHVPAELDGTAWDLVELNGQPPIAGTEIDLRFEDGTARGYSGCNWYTGPYPNAADKLQAVRFQITVQRCLNKPEGLMAQETAYGDTLQAAASRRLEDGRLEFLDEAGQVVLVFRPQAAGGTPVGTATLPPRTGDATATPVPSGDTPLEPVAEAAAVRFDGWSPDSQWAAYWLSSADDLAQVTGNALPATLHLFHVTTGESCAHPQFVSDQYGSQLAWLPDGQVVVLAADPPQQGAPCAGEFDTAEPEWPTPAPSPDPALSPGRSYIAATTIRDGSSGLLELSTTITAVANGQVVNTVEWSIDQRLGELGLGGEWVDERRFLIYETIGQGPLLVEAGGAVTQVAPDLLGVPADPGWPDVWYTARAITTPGEAGYHLLLAGGGAEHLFPPVRLYHSEDGQVEELLHTHLWSPYARPDGQWLLLDARPNRLGYESYEMWGRSLDPPSSELHLIGEGWGLWSPDGDSVVFGLKNTFSVVGFPDGSQRQQGQVSAGSSRSGYGLYPRAWSPDGRWVAFEATTGHQQAAIFIVRVVGQ